MRSDQEEGHCAEILGLSEVVDSNAVEDPFPTIIIHHVVEHLAVEPARSNAVDADIVLCPFDCETSRHSADRSFTRSELYSSLQSGVVDGAENGYPGYSSNKFYEVAPYYLLSGHTFSPGIVLMAEAKWNALSEEDQKILLEAGQKASDWNKSAIGEEEVALRKDLEDKGVHIIDMTAEDLATAQSACEPVWANYTKGIEDLLQKMVEIQK